MKFTTFFTIAILFITNTVLGQYYQSFHQQNNPAEHQPISNDQPINHVRADLMMHAIPNPQTGMVLAHIPLPAEWKVTPKGIYGPNGIEAGEFPGESLVGRPINDIDDVINTDIAYKISQSNAQFIGVIDLPAIAERDRQTFAQYWRPVPTTLSGIQTADLQSTIGLTRN